MRREIYCEKSKKTVLDMVNNRITSVKKVDVVKTGLRLYKNGCIGVAGAIGAYNENSLTDRAKQMLNFRIPYDCEPTGEIKRSVDLADNSLLTNDTFIHTSEELLTMLSRQYPQFAFNNKIYHEEYETQLKNDCGAELFWRDKQVMVGLLIKHKQSLNMMDAYGVTLSREYDLQSVFEAVSKICACYDEKIAPPAEKMPVVFLSHEDILGKFSTDLNAHMLGAGGSLFSDKIGQKLFADAFSLAVERNPLERYNERVHCFFDAEGTVLPDDRFVLIENGVLRAPFTAKKVAKQYGYALTGSAAGEYDSVPDASSAGIAVGSSGKTMKELLGGRKAIYVVLSMGGDFTPQGEYAAPVQSAFLFDGDQLCGRLPQIAIRSNIFDMFGKDFIGLATDGNMPNSPLKYLAMDMHVDTIGDWV